MQSSSMNISLLEVQLDYQSTTIIFLKDALEEAIAAKEKIELQVLELNSQITARNIEIEQLEAELRQKRTAEERDIKQIESIRSDILGLTAHVGGEQAGEPPNDTSTRAIFIQPHRQHPLHEWKSHSRMFLTARIKPTRADILNQDRVIVSKVFIDSDGSSSVVLQDPETGSKTRHQFDYCFGPDDGNDAVWTEYQGLLLDGLAQNCIVAVATDGPSGSGKTFTMFKGRNALISTTIYNILQRQSNNGKAVHVRAIEIYRNEAVDVVSKLRKAERISPPPKQSRRGLGSWKDYQTLEFPHGSTQEYIVNKILVINGRRTNKDTAMNTSRSPLRGGSSRGHLVVVINYGNTDSDAGRLVFLDLAGTEERGVNDSDIDAEYDDIRKDRSDCYAFFKNFAKNPTTYGDRTLIKILKPLLREPNLTTRIAHIFHISTTDHERNVLLSMQKKELELSTVSP